MCESQLSALLGGDKLLHTFSFYQATEKDDSAQKKMLNGQRAFGADFTKILVVGYWVGSVSG